MTQLSLFINANAEKVRSKFVAHEGQKKLTVESGGFGDFGKMAIAMTSELEKNIVDPSLREWFIPNFTTTTNTDEIVASVIMMGSLQKYFSYGFTIMCGLPSVTLLGEKADWESILTKIDRIPEFGSDPETWHQLLKPVITRFVRTFDLPETTETNNFWQQIVHWRSGDSGPDYVSGWITAFCFWDEDGKLLFPYGGLPPGRDGLDLDYVEYHQIDSDSIPPGFTSVPVKVNDDGLEYDTVMVAGSVGIRGTSSSDALARSQGEGLGQNPVGLLDTLQPESGWWIFRKGGNDRESPSY